jgi:hypothetical protein
MGLGLIFESAGKLDFQLGSNNSSSLYSSDMAKL